ncbi:MAG: hypothetical protein AABY22_36740 [Nanoarchaeota archaeon]
MNVTLHKPNLKTKEKENESNPTLEKWALDTYINCDNLCTSFLRHLETCVNTYENQKECN